MNKQYSQHVSQQLQEIIDNKLYKSERIIVNPQNPRVILKDGSELINFCANNYLGLADDAEVIESMLMVAYLKPYLVNKMRLFLMN